MYLDFSIRVWAMDVYVARPADKLKERLKKQQLGIEKKRKKRKIDSFLDDLLEAELDRQIEDWYMDIWFTRSKHK